MFASPGDQLKLPFTHSAVSAFPVLVKLYFALHTFGFVRLPVRNFKSSISLRAHCHIGTNPRKLGLVTVCTYIMTFRVPFYNRLGGAQLSMYLLIRSHHLRHKVDVINQGQGDT